MFIGTHTRKKDIIFLRKERKKERKEERKEERKKERKKEEDERNPMNINMIGKE